MKLNLLTVNNPKTQKSLKLGYLTGILHLAPSTLSGYDVCPAASPGCKALCLNTAGRGGLFKPGHNTNVIQECRIRRTKLLFENPAEFFRQLDEDIWKLKAAAKKMGLQLAIRLNGTSDLLWENMGVEAWSGLTLFHVHMDVMFYDYTKIPLRRPPVNYDLTFSLSETNTAIALAELDRGLNVAVVFHSVPEEWAGRRVVNGDESDLRFLDPKNVIVGLAAKGRAKKSRSKFVH